MPLLLYVMISTLLSAGMPTPFAIRSNSALSLMNEGENSIPALVIKSAGHSLDPGR